MPLPAREKAMKSILSRRSLADLAPTCAITELVPWWRASVAASNALAGEELPLAASPIYNSALRIAALSRTPSHAFVAGYQAAIAILCPRPQRSGDAAAATTTTTPRLPSTLSSFCVTEAGGNKPYHVHTQLSARADGALLLNGEKSFASVGQAADELVITAAVPSATTAPASHVQLALVRIPASATGVTVVPHKPLPFLCEVGHARVVLKDVLIQPEQVLPGDDGFVRYVKPFRTVEDLCIYGAMLAYTCNLLVRVSRNGGKRRACSVFLPLTSWL